VIRRRLRVAFGILCLWGLPAAASAQQSAPEPIEFSGPLLDRTHWAVEAVERLRALGEVDEHLPPQNSVPLEEVERALRAAAGAGTGALPPAGAWHARLLEEFSGVGVVHSASGRVPVVLTGRATAGVRWREGGVAPGRGEFEPERTGALPLDDQTRWVGVGETALAWGSHLGLSARLESDEDGVRFDRLEVAVGWGRVRASVGRTPVGYAHGRGGGVLLGGDAALDAIQLGTREPFRLPFFLRVLGPVSVHTFLGRMWEDRHPGDPYFWGGSAYLQPHPRITFGIHRAALFGGKEDDPVTVKKVLGMLVGRVASHGFEDQIVSVSGRFDLPTEEVLPLTAYLEWGSEDAAGAWHDVPGIVGGLWSPSLPFAPGVAMGAEYAHFSTSCCGNPKWYRHWSFVGSWASRDLPLGHPLGGNGRQAMVFAEAYLLDARARLGGSVYRRDRKDENLFAPGREGGSTGGSFSLEVRPFPSWELRLEAAEERGDDWSDRNVRIEVSYF